MLIACENLQWNQMFNPFKEDEMLRTCFKFQALFAATLLVLAGGLIACAAPTAVPTTAPAPKAAATTVPAAAPTTAPTAAPTTAPIAAPTAVPPTATVGKPIDVVFWYSQGGTTGEAIEAQVKQFNAAQKEVIVKAEFQGDYYQTRDKLTAAIAAGAVPDIVLLEVTQPPFFVEQGALQPLDDLAKQTKTNMDDYIPGLLKEGVLNGKSYTIPFIRSTPLLYYNKDLFKAAGLDPEKPPSTWADLLAYSQKLTKKEGDKASVVGFATYGKWWPAVTQLKSAGCAISEPDTLKVQIAEPACVEALQFWSDMVNKEKVATLYIAGAAPQDDVERDFVNGKVAMMVLSTATLTRIEANAKFALGSGFIPPKVAGTNAVPTGGSGLSILAKSKNPLAAWKFVDWVTATDQTTDLSIKLGYMPARTSAIQSAKMAAFYKEHPNFKVAGEQLKYASPSPSVMRLPKAVALINTLIERIFIGQTPVKAALDQTATEFNQEVEAYKKSQ
jgi:sn-glycerol 3-phosphate transport system substrate-binding protein